MKKKEPKIQTPGPEPESISFSREDQERLRKIFSMVERLKKDADDTTVDLADVTNELAWEFYYGLDERFNGADQATAPKPQTSAPAESTPKGETKMLVSKKALQEIGVTIHHSLETAINVCLECSQCYNSGDAAALIMPAVERLAAIARENDFPE